jgi:hypothetical protein
MYFPEKQLLISTMVNHVARMDDSLIPPKVMAGRLGGIGYVEKPAKMKEGCCWKE